MAAHMRPYKRICTWTYVRTYINSARNLRSVLRYRASSRWAVDWAVDCAARRALSATLRLESRASLSSALFKARFLRSRSLLRLSLASLLACASTYMCRSRSKVDLMAVHDIICISRRGTFMELRNIIIRINRDVQHLRNDMRVCTYHHIDSAAIEATRRGSLRLAPIKDNIFIVHVYSHECIDSVYYFILAGCPPQICPAPPHHHPNSTSSACNVQ